MGRCEKRESGGVQCELEAGHSGFCACPEALKAFLLRGSMRYETGLSIGMAVKNFMNERQNKMKDSDKMAIVNHGHGLLKEAILQIENDPINLENLESAHDLALAASQVLGLCARLAKK